MTAGSPSDVHRVGRMTAAPLSPAEQAVVARFDAAPTLPESQPLVRAVLALAEELEGQAERYDRPASRYFDKGKAAGLLAPSRDCRPRRTRGRAMSAPTQTCRLCGRHVVVRDTGRGFPPDNAKRKLQRLCEAAGCSSEPKYRAGVAPALQARLPQADRYTDEELLGGIQRALQARDMDAAAGLIRRLAVQNPRAAQTILDGLGIARTVTP